MYPARVSAKYAPTGSLLLSNFSLEPGPSSSQTQQFIYSQHLGEDFDEIEGVITQGEDGKLYAAFEDTDESDPIDMQFVTTLEVATTVTGEQSLTITAQRPSDDAADDEDDDPTEALFTKIAGGVRFRRNRQEGTCRCPECGEAFINAARLERHFSVHQVFGSFFCPLCGKTYKYEYNLFYHWRRTCRDLNELIGTTEERRYMDVHALRALVDEVAAKKQEIGPIGIGISRSLLFQSGPLAKLETPNSLGKRGISCRACGVVVPVPHVERHLRIHRGEFPPDDRTVFGGYFCDLCGYVFRQHFNLIKHWRTSCPEIQANLPSDCELTLSDTQLRQMVQDLIRKAATTDIDDVDLRVAAARSSSVPHLSRIRRHDVASGQMGEEDFRLAEEQGLVFADDHMDDEAVGRRNEKDKWSLENQPVNCPECFRTFANAGRLERHIAGFHASYGAHHCMLCGNRFKYDYNLLYHYRRSCPYTKTYLDPDMREQIDATSLRRVVRLMAQRDLKITPILGATQRITRSAHISNDEIVRRQMLKPTKEPPALLTVPRNDQGKSCPICDIVFYGPSAIEMHMRRAHGQSLAEAEANAKEQQQYADFNADDDDEAPPILEPEVTLKSNINSSLTQQQIQIEEEQEEQQNNELVQLKSKRTIVQVKKADGFIQEYQFGCIDDSEIKAVLESGQIDVSDGDEVLILSAGNDEAGPEENIMYDVEPSGSY